MDPQQRQTAKTFDSYKDTYSEAVDFFTRVKAGYIGEIVDRHFGTGSKPDALDIGCGVGNYHALLSPRFRRLCGVDVSSDCISVARERNAGVEYQVYDGEKLPYDDGCFDLTYAICVMHHVPPTQWPKFAVEMRRVLKPGGLALVFEHNPRNPLTMRAVNSCPFDDDAVLLPSTSTESLLRGAGFKDVGSRFILAIPAANAFLRRVDQVLGGLPFGGQYYTMAKA